MISFYFTTAIVLNINIALIIARPNLSCSRTPPRSTDCSATTGQCNLLFSDTNTFAGQLPFPPPNTRSCYRTCHEGQMCKSFGTGINEREIKIDIMNADFKTYRIFSPNYGRGDYRKSTNCRYTVKCEPGQLLSYSVAEFDLEEEDTCYDQQECLDRMEITYANLGTTQRFCGSGEVGEIHVDGANEITFEFSTNRRFQKSGFLYFVTCFNPGFDVNAVDTDIVPSPPLSIGFPDFNPNTCSKPYSTALKPTIFEIPSDINGAPPLNSRYVVSMSGAISYQNGIIQIMDGTGDVLNAIRGISCLDVDNRFSTSAQHYFQSSIAVNFNGYGFLDIRGENANYYQLGADPVFQPTPEESRIILELEKEIAALLPPDFFDVADIYDDIEDAIPLPLEEEPIFATTGPVITIPAPQKRAVFATALANEYGNACNAVLHAAACTYQALVLGVDCKTGLYLS